MAKPEARESGAPIQYFTASKPTKADKGNWARQNEVALSKANQQIMAWRGQYERDFGRPVANYGMRTNLPPAPKPKFVPSKPEKKKKGITIDETGGVSGSTTDKSEHGQTVALEQRKAMIDGIISQLQNDAREGAIKAQIEGINKPKKKNWFERNIGSHIGDAYNAVASSVVGDVTGRTLDIISRPNQAALGVVSWALEQNLLNPDQLTSSTATKNPDKIPRDKWNKMTPEQQAKAKADYAAAQEVIKEGPGSRFVKGLTGKEKNYSTTANFQRQIDQATGYKPSTAAKIGGGVAGFASDVAVDPTNLLGAGIAKKGVEAVRRARTADEIVTAARDTALATKVASDTAEAVKGTKIADNVLARLATEEPATWKAPLELGSGPKPLAELGSGLPGRGFELTDEAKAAARTQEIAATAEKAATIKDASEPGFRALRNETAKQARAVEAAKAMVKKGTLTEEQLAERVAVHSALLKRMEQAQQIREVAKAAPVGGSVARQERLVERLGKIVSANPKNMEAARKLAVAHRDLQAARLAALPENADRVLELTKTIAKGGTPKLDPATVKAVVNSSPSVQDQLIALMKSAEEGGVKTATKRAPKVVKDAADLPSNRIMAAINDAANKATATAASKATIADAAAIAKDPTSSAHATQAALDILNDAGIFGRPLTKAGIRTKVAQEALKMVEDSAVQERALASTGRKVSELRASGQKLIPSAQKAAMFNESLLEEVLPTTEAMTRILEDGIGKRFAIRVGGKDLGEFRPIGTALRAMYVPFELVGKLGQTGPGQLAAKAFKMGAHFPDETNYIRQAAENEGIATHIQWANAVTKEFTDTITHEEAKQIRRAIEGGYSLTNPHLEELRKRAIQLSNEIFQKQAAIGKYLPSQSSDGYVYHYYHSRNKKAIKGFKDARTADIRAGRKGATVDTAKAAGLKPEERIDRILIMQHRDFVRDLQRANFRQGVISNFGVKTDNAALANGLGLEEVSGKNMNKMFQDVAAAEGSKWYLAPEIHDTFKSMDKLMGIGHNADADGFLGAYDAFVRMFKTSATIANPGNWVNNTIGDFFLNYIDGVRSPGWYKRAAGVLGSHGQEGVKEVSIAGRRIDAGKLLDAFKHKAPSGGFIRSEGMGHISRLGNKGIKGVPSRFIRGGQNLYETREEWVRLAHFMHATDDETRRLLGRGYSFDKAFDAGTELAAKRVAKWNIDYTAITPFERAIRKRFVPFYTFMRKATPLMLEAMITRPGKLVHYDRARRSIEMMLGVPPIEDDGTNWPFWAKQQGITRITNGNEPLYVRDPTPLNVVNRLLGGDSYRAPLLNLANQTAPPIRMAGEVATGKSLFNDRPIDNWGQWALGQIPTASIIARASGHPLSPQKTSGTNKGGGTSVVERLGVLGVPVGKMTEARQQAELHSEINQNSDIFKRVNAAIAPYKITKTTSKKNGTYYIVKDPSGKIISRARDFNQAVRITQGSG